jgi:hypothetical protein
MRMLLVGDELLHTETQTYITKLTVVLEMCERHDNAAKMCYKFVSEGFTKCKLGPPKSR